MKKIPISSGHNVSTFFFPSMSLSFFCTGRKIKHSFNLHLPPSLALNSLMMFSFLWHARTTCVGILKPFVGSRESFFFFLPTIVNAPQIPVGVRGVNTASLSGLSEKRCYCLLWTIKLVVCSFIQKERERERWGGGDRER